ncbi:MFS transporter [Aestuariibacter sp. GS-14]|uniref:MFS transporter n=1 Tax=Aestuariibacter sp. GS-14 TaxID=2590670 RepID=UPI0015E84272|nr:MFS transporter [Aestuariibacter sp. GS-14]
MVTGNHNRPQGIVLLFVPVFIMLGPVLISPIVGTLFQHFSGQAYARVLVPLLLTAPALCLALCSPIAGKLANRIGGKKVLVGSLAFYGLMGAAPMLVDSLYGMLASRLLLGVAEAGIITGSMVLTAAYFNGDERQKWIAYQNIALPLIGAALLFAVGQVSRIDWHYTFALYGLSFLVFIAAAAVLYEPAITGNASGSLAAPVTPASSPSSSASSVIPLNTMLLLVALAIPGSLAFYAVPVKLSFVLQELGQGSPAVVGQIMSMGLIFGSPVGAILARLVKRWAFGKALALAMALMGAGLILLGIASDTATVTAAVIIQQAGGGLMLVVALTYVLHVAPVQFSGSYSGFWWLVYTLANFATPLVLTTIDTFTSSSAVTMLVVGLIIVALPMWLLNAKRLSASMTSDLPDNIPAKEAQHG